MFPPSQGVPSELRYHSATILRAVGVVGREHHDHRLVEDLEQAGIARGGQPVRQGHGRLGRRDLGGVDAVVEGHDGLARGDEPASLVVREAARIGEAQVRLADLLEARHVGLAT